MDQKAQEPGFWDDIQRSQSILQKSKRLRDRLNVLNNLVNDCEDIFSLVELALEESEESITNEVVNGFNDIKNRFEKLRLQTLLKGEYDRNDAILTLHAGAGGTEIGRAHV